MNYNLNQEVILLNTYNDQKVRKGRIIGTASVIPNAQIIPLYCVMLEEGFYKAEDIFVSILLVHESSMKPA